MSMISEQIKEIEAVKHKYELQNINLLARVPAEYDIKVISGAISTIKELSGKLRAANMERSSQYYNGGWIPCEERLPETYDDVLICVNGYPGPNIIFISIGSYCKTEGWILNDYPEWTMPEVIAWAPIPKPYQPKGGEDYERYQDNC